MTRLRVIIIGLLGLAPWLFLIGVGGYHLWDTGWFFYAWWPMAACWMAAYLLTRRWGNRQRRQMDAEAPPLHWTDRDKLAWRVVEAQLKATEKIDMEKLTEPQFYFDTSLKLARDLAKVYHPHSSQPMANLTVLELLSVVELAAQDLGKLANEYFPGGHLLTLNNLQQAQGAMKWYQRATNIWWAVSAVLDPIRTGARFAASRAGLGKPLDLLKQNAVQWLYAMFVQRLGHYLIELYSGRLRVGVSRYKTLLAEHQAAQTQGPPIVSADGQPTTPKPVTITLIGQVKAGKSSVINAILGDERARTDVIPATAGVHRYELHGPGASLVLVDTQGYNQAGADADQLAATIEAAQQSDLIFLVTHARNPGRQADVSLLKELFTWFADRPRLKLPPILVVMTHIDLLSPAMEWSPPYNWRKPTRTKENNIAAAAEVIRQQLGEKITAIVPVCTRSDAIFAIKEELLPEVTQLLGEARAVAMLRCLQAEADEGQVRRLFDQLLNTGKLLLQSTFKR
jgi:predicted GTPase